MKLMLIGGGEIGRGSTSYETKEIDEEIVKMTEKVEPNFLFIGLASSFSDSYYDTIKKIYANLGCKTSYLKKKNIQNNRNIVEEKINNADIIYIGGGDTIKLINDVKEYEIDELIINAGKRGCVLAGISAGAILLSKEGYSDSYILRKEKDKYEFINGLSLSNIAISPHYEAEGRKTKELKEDIGKREVYALENNTALKIIDDKIEVVKSNKENNAYKIKYDKKIIIEKI